MSIVRDDGGNPLYFQCSAVPTVQRASECEPEEAPLDPSRVFGDLFQGALVEPGEVRWLGAVWCAVEQSGLGAWVAG
jgi:hypothetical protein